MKVTSVRPILRIFDLQKAKEFYVDWLGFKVDWEHRYGENFPIYMQVSRDNLILHLSEHHGDACPGAKVYVVAEQVQDFYNEVTAKDYKYNKPGFDQEKSSFDVIDPFGNRISFNQEKK